MKSRRFMKSSRLLLSLNWLRRFALASLLSSALLVEEVRIAELSCGDVVQQPLQMPLHGNARGGRIMRLDGGEDRHMLGDDLRHAPRLRQGEPAVAVDMNLHLLDQRPDPGISGDFGNCSVEGFVGLVKAFAISRRVSLALPLQDRLQIQDLTR